MIKLEGKGPVKEMELFFDVLCNYGFIRSRSRSFVNIEGDRSLIEAEVGVPKWICQGYPEPAADGDQRFITEEQIPDRVRMLTPFRVTKELMAKTGKN